MDDHIFVRFCALIGINLSAIDGYYELDTKFRRFHENIVIRRIVEPKSPIKIDSIPPHSQLWSMRFMNVHF